MTKKRRNQKEEERRGKKMERNRDDVGKPTDGAGGGERVVRVLKG